MKTNLTDTTASSVAAAIIKGRRSIGSPAMGMVLTLIVVTDRRHRAGAVEAAEAASREHPSRVLVVTASPGTARSGLDAEIRMGEDVPGELVHLVLRGEVAEHPASVILPLLLPDSPVVVWWPGESPLSPGEDAIGQLGTRRITDAMGAKRPLAALEDRAANLMRGDTDLCWTRLTPWRALLAAAVDQYPSTIVSATVEGARGNASSDLLAAWLECRLGLEVTRRSTRGPGITAARLGTPAGDIAVTRADGLLAEYVVPGQPVRNVALRRRDLDVLLAEELRRVDYDDIFEAAADMLVVRSERERRRRDQAAAAKTDAKKPGATKTDAKKTGAKKTDAKKKSAKKAGAKTAGAAKPAASAPSGQRPTPSAMQQEAAAMDAAVPTSPLEAGLVTD